MVDAATKPVLIVVAPSRVADPEYLETRAALERRGIPVEVAGVTTAEATGYKGLRVKPDLPIDQADAGRYQAVAVIGGEGTIEFLWEHSGLRRLLIESARRCRYTAAICAGPGTLARAGLLRGKRATAYRDEQVQAELIKGGASPQPVPVVVDGAVVTGQNPQAAPEFGETLAGLLAS